MSSSRFPSNRPTFPFYLLPSLPFRRRSSTKSTTSFADAAAFAAPVFIRPGLQTPSASQESPLSPLSTSPNSQPVSSTSTSTGSSLNNEDLPSMADVIRAAPGRDIPGTSSTLPPRTPTYEVIFSESGPNGMPLTPSTAQTTPSTLSPSSSTSQHSSAITTPSSLSSSPSDGGGYSKLGSAALPGPPISYGLIATKLHRTPETLRCVNCSTDIAFASQIISKGFTGRHGRAYLLSPLPPTPTKPGAENCATTNSPAIPQTSRFNLLDPFGSFSSSQSSNSTNEDEEGEGKSNRYNLLNITTHAPSRRQLVTGLHVVADISCKICEKVLGWKYVDASETSQRYKIGKFILETKRVIAYSAWEDRFLGDLDDLMPGLLDCSEKEFLREFAKPFYEDGTEGASPSASGRMAKGTEKSTRAHLVAHDGQVEKGKGWDSNGEVEFDSGDEEECEEIFAGTWDREVVRRRRAKIGALQKKAA